MTGGGFGGCSVNLVRRERFESFQQKVGLAYHAASNISPSIYMVEASAGAHEITS
jgi:galactokinase